MPILIRAVATLALLASFPMQSLAATPAGTVAPEYDLKAVFLFHFAEFVEWPLDAFAAPGSPLTVGVLGDSPFGGALEEIMANETVRGRKLRVAHLHSVEEADSCQILYISQSEGRRLNEVLAALSGHSVLTVSDVKDFADHDGMIGFVTTRDRVRLRVNLAAATAARLSISSKLLRQAEIVGPTRRAP